MMKAITVLQPWASLITFGAKKVEMQSWSANCRGPLQFMQVKPYRL